MHARLTRTAAFALAAFAAASRATAGDDEKYTLDGANIKHNDQAAQSYDRALGLLKAGKTDEAIAKLVEMQDKYGDVLVRVDSVAQFVSARRLAQKVVLDSGEKSLAPWRALIDPRVDAALISARGVEDLRQILRDYPLATRAAETWMRLAGLLGDHGDAEGLVEALTGMLDMPVPSGPTALAAARLAFALGSLNDASGLAALEIRMKDNLGDAVVIRGKQATLRDAIATARKSLRVAGEAAPVWAAWSTLGGSGSRDRIAGPISAIPPVTSKYEFGDGATLLVDNGGWRNPSQAWNPHSEDYRPILPAVADGVMVVSEGNRVWAADIVGSGDRQLWELRTSDSSDVLFEERQLHVPTISGGRVFACLAASHEEQKEKLGWLKVIYPIPLRRLYALDAQTGRVLWQRGGDRAGKDFDRRASYHGSPVVDGNRIYCAATWWQNPTDIVQHFVVCMDAATGAEIWRKFIASGIQEVNLFNNNTRESIPLSLTVSGDRIFTCTNLGVIACLERADGQMIWARRYPRFRVEPITEPTDIPRLPMSWFNNPIFVATDPKDGKRKVLVTPMDSPFLLSLSVEDGTQFSMINGMDTVKGSDRNRTAMPLRHMIGVRDGIVYLSGRVVIGLHIGSLKRISEEVQLDSNAAGRGILATDGVYVPTTRGLQKFGFGKDLPAGARLIPWPGGEDQAGNIVLADQAILTASNTTLSVAYDASKVLAFLEAEITRSPASPWLHYRLGLCRLQSGETEKAEASLREALRLAVAAGGDTGEEIATACRRTLFRNRVTAASIALRRADGARRAAAELEKAKAFAQTDGEWLEVLFEMARAYRIASDPTAAIVALQEIVEKHGTALVEGDEPARGRAAREIDSLLDTNGRAPYAVFETAAAELLVRARAASDPAMFDEVTRRFPNSLAAEEAEFGAGHALFAAGDWAGACDQFGKFLRAHPASVNAPQATAEMAIGFEKRGMLGMASAQLRRLKKMPLGLEIKVDGATVKAAAWAESKLAGPDYALAAGGGPVPALAPPLEKAWTYTTPVNGDCKALDPEGMRSWKSSVIPFQIGVWIAGLDAATGKELWRTAAPPVPRWSGWSSGFLLVAGSGEVRAYRESGEPAWQTAFDGTDVITAKEADGALFVFARGSRGPGMTIAALDTSTGHRLWSNALPATTRDMWITEERILWRTSDGAVYAGDRETGTVTTRWALPAQRIVQAGRDRLLAYSATGARPELAAWDASTGRRLWSQAVTGLRADAPMEVRGGLAAICSFEGESFRLRTFDLESGKIVADASLGGQWLKQFLCDDETAYVVFKNPDPPNLFTISAWSLKTGKKVWEAPLRAGITSLFPGMVAKDHVVLNCPVFRRPNAQAVGEWVPTLIVLDKKTGTESGTIEGRPAATPTYSMGLEPGKLLLTQDNTVEAWGK